MKVLGLFSGIGGFELGFTRAGFEISGMVEINPFCQSVLRNNFPGIPVFRDVIEVTRKALEDNGIGPIDVLCGGFPCQDISVAGRKTGIAGPRSGLWREYARLIGEIRPRYVVVENVPGVPGGYVGTWLGAVLGDLAAIGYDAEWHCIPAAAVGAHHRRDRVWIIAYPDRAGFKREAPIREQFFVTPRLSALLANHVGHRLPDGLPDGLDKGSDPTGEEIKAIAGCHRPRWSDQPDVGMLVHGLPRQLAGWRKASIMALGNSVVPQVAELIGRAIMQINNGGISIGATTE